MTKLFFILVYSLYEKKFQKFKISKIKNFKDPKFQNLKISISKKKVARFFSKPEKNSYGEPPEINCTWLN